jgi:hypothetical protein
VFLDLNLKIECFLQDESLAISAGCIHATTPLHKRINCGLNLREARVLPRAKGRTIRKVIGELLVGDVLFI